MCGTIFIYIIHTSSMIQQLSNNLHIIILSCCVETLQTIIIRTSHTSAMFQKLFDNVHMDFLTLVQHTRGTYQLQFSSMSNHIFKGDDWVVFKYCYLHYPQQAMIQQISDNPHIIFRRCCFERCGKYFI